MRQIQKPMLENPSAESEKRIIETLDHLRKGWSRAKCIRWIRDKYDIKDSTAYKYLHDAVYYMQEGRDVLEDEVEATKLIQRERLENIVEATIESQQYNTAMRAIDLINKLEQLYVDKQEVDVKVNDMRFKFGDE